MHHILPEYPLSLPLVMKQPVVIGDPVGFMHVLLMSHAGTDLPEAYN